MGCLGPSSSTRSFSTTAPAGFSLRATALSHGWYEIPPFRWDDEALILTVAVAGPRGGIRCLDIRQPTPGQSRRLRLRWRSAGRPPSGQSAERQGRKLARRVLNLDLDLTPFHELCRTHQPLRWVARAGAGRILRGPSLFSDVVASICSTNVQWKQAVRMVHRLSDVAPRVSAADPPRFPFAQELLSAGEQLLRRHARLGYRAASVLRLCEDVVSGATDLGPAERGELDGPELRAFFRSLPGIGPVTARYLATLHGHFDSLAVDSLVRAYLGDKHFGGRRPSDKEVQAIYAPFGPWRALAYWFEFLGDVDPVTWRGWEHAGNG